MKTSNNQTASNSTSTAVKVKETPKMGVIKKDDKIEDAKIIEEVKPTNTETSTQKTEAEPKRAFKTAEEVKQKAKELGLLAERHDRLKETIQKIKEFAISHEANNCELEIMDANGQTLTSSSPEAIKRFLDFYEQEYAFKIAETEKRLQELEII